MSIMKDAHSHISSLSYIAPFTPLHTQVSGNPSIFSTCTFLCIDQKCHENQLAQVCGCASTMGPCRSRVTCSVRIGGTGGTTRHQNSILSLPHITTGHRQTSRSVSAIACHRSADPGPPHRQKMVRCQFYTLNKYRNKYIQTHNHFVQGFSCPSIPTLQSPNQLFTQWTQTTL